MPDTTFNSLTFNYTPPASGTTGFATLVRYPAYTGGFVNIPENFVLNGVTYTVNVIAGAFYDTYISGVAFPGTIVEIGIGSFGNVNSVNEIYFKGALPFTTRERISYANVVYALNGITVSGISAGRIVYLSQSEMDSALRAKNTSSLPSTPSGLIVNSITPTMINPTIQISFRDPENTSITNYSWSKNGINYTPLNPPQKTSPLIIPATGLTLGTSHTFSIKAINPIGTSSASNSISSIFNALPSAPTITSINGVSQDNKISISFANPSNIPNTNYSWSADGINYTVLSPPQNSSPLFIPVNGLISDSSYMFSIKAINSVGTSQASFYFEPSLIRIALPTPAIEKVSYVFGLVYVYYKQSLIQETGVTSIKYSIDNGITYTSINNITSPLKISGLNAGTKNQIILKSNNGSDSEPSKPYSFTYNVKVGKKPV